jgi:pimeloyl-ACP methyl ester carboxylesterase
MLSHLFKTANSETLSFNFTELCIKSLIGHELLLETYQPEFTDTVSPAHLPNLQRNLPALLMYGLNDDLVPHGHGDSLLTSLNTKFGTIPGTPDDFTSQHKLLKYDNCGHGWSGGGCAKDEIRADVITWLAAHF